MAYALVAQTKAFGTNGYTSPAIDTTGATLLVVCVGYDGAITLSDSKGNGAAWQSAFLQDNFWFASQIFFVENPVVGASHTVAIAGTGTNSALQFYAFSGAKTSSVLDQVNGNDALGASAIDINDITPTENDELVVAMTNGLGFSGGDPTVNGGFVTPYGDPGAGGVYEGVYSSYLIQTAAAVAGPTFTRQSGSDHMSGAIASFKAAPVPPATREQEGFRFRNDDGSESSATWYAAQDTNASVVRNTPKRLRILTDVTNDPPSTALKLQYRRADGADEWKDVD